MEQKSLREMYLDERRKPSPSQLFIKRIADICIVAEITVKGWVTGNTKPGKAVCLLLEREFETPWQVLFPEWANAEEENNNH